MVDKNFKSVTQLTMILIIMFSMVLNVPANTYELPKSQFPGISKLAGP